MARSRSSAVRREIIKVEIESGLPIAAKPQKGYRVATTLAGMIRQIASPLNLASEAKSAVAKKRSRYGIYTPGKTGFAPEPPSQLFGGGTAVFRKSRLNRPPPTWDSKAEEIVLAMPTPDMEPPVHAPAHRAFTVPVPAKVKAKATLWKGFAAFRGAVSEQVDLYMKARIWNFAFADISSDLGLKTLTGWANAVQNAAIEGQKVMPDYSQEGHPPHAHKGVGEGLRDIQTVYVRGARGQMFALVGAPKHDRGTVDIDGVPVIPTGVPVPQIMEHGGIEKRAFPIENPQSWRGPIVWLQGRAYAVVTLNYGSRQFMRPALLSTI